MAPPSPAPASVNVNGSGYILPTNAPGLANYPHARKLPNGIIHISGISSRNPDNKSWRGVTDNPDGTYTLSIQEQTRAVLDNILLILQRVGEEEGYAKGEVGLERLVDLTVFLVDMKDYALFNETYNTYFPHATTSPSRTCIGVRELPNPRLLIEIKGVAYLHPRA